VFPAVNFTQAYANGNGFISLLQGNRDITGALSLQNEFLMSTGTKNLRRKPWYLINPSFSLGLLYDYLDDFVKLSQQGIGGIAIEGYGSDVYADLYDSVLNDIAARTPVDRQTAVALWSKGMDAAKEKAGQLMVRDGNQYVIGHSDHIVGIPMKSSYFKISGMEIPYYQILTSGLVRTASAPVNFSIDPEAFLLDCLETGVAPMYSLIGNGSDKIKNTWMDHLYNGEYTKWVETATKNHNKYKDIYRQINGCFIVDHEILDDGITITRFDNGKMLIIDHEKMTAELEDNWEKGKDNG
jgi:hypothetical protein